MNYSELKTEVEILRKSKTKIKCKGFEESFEFLHFKTFFALLDSPQYSVMQAKDNPEMGTSEDQWFLTFVKDNQMVVIDIADEDTICDEFYQLMLIWFNGSQTVMTKNQTFFDKVKSKFKH